MEEFREVLDEGEKLHKSVPGLVSVMAILNYLIFGILVIGSLYSLGLFLFESNFSEVGRYDSNAYNRILFWSIVTILILALPIYGAALMHKGRKKGFVIYTTAVGTMSIFILWITWFPSGRVSSTDVIQTSIISGVALFFIIIFATQLKHLN
ncbi:MAG: hypothetical protein GQ574_15120 [Crocinitomix sp.]|nr:hypothetical protein [Crocinitomix sp.]